MSENLMKCALPDCRVRAVEGELFVPPFQALRRLNGDKPVRAGDVPRYAICRSHNRQWRSENGMAQTMRLPQALRAAESADKRADERRSERDAQSVEARLMASHGERTSASAPAATAEREERNERPARKPRRHQPERTVTKDGTRGAVAVGQGLAACAARDRAALLMQQTATTATPKNGAANKPATATPAEAAL